MSEERKTLNALPLDTKGRIIALAALALVLITVWFSLELVIVTFVLTFIFQRLTYYTELGISKTPIKKIPYGLLVVIIYLAVIALVVSFSVYYVPILAVQITGIARSFVSFNFADFVGALDPSLKSLVNTEFVDVNEYFAKIGAFIMDHLATFGATLLNILAATLLSFLLLLEKNKILRICAAAENSRIAGIYRYFASFGVNFCRTFSKVMRVQILIAAINCAISLLYLSIAGFPNILALGIMIFVLGLIPVAGVFISLVPLSIIAFNVGGVEKIVEVLIMVAIIHCLEAYFLNPKLMSHKTHLPVSIVFIILLVAEKYLGAWGLLIGVPIFIYLLTVLDVRYEDEEKAARAEKKAALAQRKARRAAKKVGAQGKAKAK